MLFVNEVTTKFSYFFDMIVVYKNLLSLSNLTSTMEEISWSRVYYKPSSWSSYVFEMLKGMNKHKNQGD